MLYLRFLDSSVRSNVSLLLTKYIKTYFVEPKFSSFEHTIENGQLLKLSGRILPFVETALNERNVKLQKNQEKRENQAVRITMEQCRVTLDELQADMGSVALSPELIVKKITNSVNNYEITKVLNFRVVKDELRLALNNVNGNALTDQLLDKLVSVQQFGFMVIY